MKRWRSKNGEEPGWEAVTAQCTTAPEPLGWIKRCWKEKKQDGIFFVLFVLFLLNVEGILQG